jgi:tRNA threonylcarbamoyladenosine biosynthesis protein TsaE
MVLMDLTETASFARRLGPCLRTGDVVALYGDLGAGKTAFTRALIQGLQARAGEVEEVPSPTFSLVQQYEVDGLLLWHFDLYRLTSPEEAYELGIDEAFAEGVSLIEWPDRLGELLPEGRLSLSFEIPEDTGPFGEKRLLRVEGNPDWGERLKHV